MPLSLTDAVTIRGSAVEIHWVPLIYKVLPLPSKKSRHQKIIAQVMKSLTTFLE